MSESTKGEGEKGMQAAIKKWRRRVCRKETSRRGKERLDLRRGGEGVQCNEQCRKEGRERKSAGLS